ncbi:MAG: hypothetical protein WDW38_006584 [Sanguina aurantia]
MSQSAIDIDYGEWKTSVARLLRGATFSGRDGERGPDMNKTMGVGEHFDEYRDNTNLMGAINATSTSNQYLLSIVNAENKRVGRLDAEAKRDIYKLQEQSLSVVYGADLCGFLTVVVKVVLVTAMLVLAVLSMTVQKLISPRSGAILAVLVILIFGVVLFCMSTSAARRRNNGWNRYYFDAGAAGGST